MKEELDRKLCEDFPILYQQRGNSMQQTAMCWGFEHGDGWEPLIRELSEKIETYNKEHPDNPVEATQIKEKYGSLRFYVSNYPDKIDKLIDEAETKSETTCELCGKESKGISGKGWYVNYCDECLKRKNDE